MTEKKFEIVVNCIWIAKFELIFEKKSTNYKETNRPLVEQNLLMKIFLLVVTTSLNQLVLRFINNISTIWKWIDNVYDNKCNDFTTKLNKINLTTVFNHFTINQFTSLLELVVTTTKASRCYGYMFNFNKKNISISFRI